MLFVIFGDEIPSDLPEFTVEKEREAIDLRFDISVLEEGSSTYKLLATDSGCFDISAPDKMPSFSGSVRYEALFTTKDGYTVLDLGQVGEVAEVWLNGSYLGARICPPYKFSMKNHLVKGQNRLEIKVISNLAHRRRDLFSSFITIPPTGILGDISICKYE